SVVSRRYPAGASGGNRRLGTGGAAPKRPPPGGAGRKGASVTDAITTARELRVEGPVSGTDKTLHFETGKLAQQSQGAVLSGIGDTLVLATANAASSSREG